MIVEMDRVNQDQKNDSLVIGSTDVVALYPNLDIEFTIDKVCKIFFESNISVRGTDDLELGLYLALTTSPEVLTTMGIADVCPTRKTSRGRPPTITASGSEEQKEKRFKPWNLPVKQPAIKRNDRPCGNIVERNTVVRYSNFK